MAGLGEADLFDGGPRGLLVADKYLFGLVESAEHGVRYAHSCRLLDADGVEWVDGNLKRRLGVAGNSKQKKRQNRTDDEPFHFCFSLLKIAEESISYMITIQVPIPVYGVPPILKSPIFTGLSILLNSR